MVASGWGSRITVGNGDEKIHQEESVVQRQRAWAMSSDCQGYNLSSTTY